jgi:putative hydrolase of the HAD superfamily
MLIQVRRFIDRQPAGQAARSQGRPWRSGPEMHPAPVIRALLFDAAGTLIEPAEPVAEVYVRHAAACGLPLDVVRVREAFGHAFGASGDPAWELHPEGDAAEREWWKGVVGLTLGRAAGCRLCDDRVAACFEALFEHYACFTAWRVFPEVAAVLDEARREGLRVAVVSNFDRRLHRILEGAGLSFDFVLTSADARVRKPDPAIFRHALDRLGLPSAEVLHAGDSAMADVAGARAAGIEPYLLDRPRRSLRGFLDRAMLRRGK